MIIIKDEKAIFSNPVLQIDVLKIDESDIQLLNDEFVMVETDGAAGWFVGSVEYTGVSFERLLKSI